jgi:DNA gyrase/topoisomerase IV subunit A
MITRNGMALRIDISNLQEYSRNAGGVKLIDLSENDLIACVGIIR